MLTQKAVRLSWTFIAEDFVASSPIWPADSLPTESNTLSHAKSSEPSALLCSAAAVYLMAGAWCFYFKCLLCPQGLEWTVRWSGHCHWITGTFVSLYSRTLFVVTSHCSDSSVNDCDTEAKLWMWALSAMVETPLSFCASKQVHCKIFWMSRMYVADITMQI